MMLEMRQNKTYPPTGKKCINVNKTVQYDITDFENDDITGSEQIVGLFCPENS